MKKINWAIVHDVDGCMIVDDDRLTPGTTILCRYSPIDVDKALNKIIQDKLLSEGTAINFLKNRAIDKFRDPRDIARCADYAYYDERSLKKDDLIEIKARVNQGLTEELMNKALDEIKFTLGVKDYILWAKRHGAKQLVITDGWDPVAKYIVGKFGLEYGEGVKPVFESGIFTGRVEKIDKATIIDRKMKEYEIENEYTVAIDDNNIFIAEYGLPIAFCPKNPKTFENYQNVFIINEPHYVAVFEKTKAWGIEKGIIRG